MTQQTTIDPRLISFNALRKTVGWLGIALPFSMILGNRLFSDCCCIEPSNSHYYYTATGGLFIGILCAVGLFLMAYKGYDLPDNILTSAAGVFAVLIALFPTNDTSTNLCGIIHLPDNDLRSAIHYISASLFFVILAVISLFRFTKSSGHMTKKKKSRNTIYRICGIAMLVFIALIAVYSIWEGELTGWAQYKPVFWLETLALIAFGISWLVKGELVLKDPGTK
jgi:hypothetical protein